MTEYYLRKKKKTLKILLVINNPIKSERAAANVKGRRLGLSYGGSLFIVRESSSYTVKAAMGAIAALLEVSRKRNPFL